MASVARSRTEATHRNAERPALDALDGPAAADHPAVGTGLGVTRSAWPLLAGRARPFVTGDGASAAARALAVVCSSGAVGAAYAAAGALGVWLLHHTLQHDFATLAPRLGIPWLAVGIAVAGLMLFGWRAAPGVFLGSYLTWGVAQGDPPLSVGIDALGETASVVLIVWLLKVWGYRVSLARYQDTLILIAAAALGRLVSAAVDIVATFAVAWTFSAPDTRALLEAAGVYREGRVFLVNPALFTFNFRWWANSVAGIVLVVPLLAPLAAADPRWRNARSGELAVWALASPGWIVIAYLLPGLQPRIALLALALVLVVTAALRFGVALASLLTLVFSIGATVGFALQLGAFAGVAGRESTEVAWGFIGLLAGAGLFLTPLLAGRAAAQRRLGASVERYRRLFVANPSPMWAEDAVSGRILLANDAALRAYGYAESEFLMLRAGDLEAGGGAAAAGGAPYETSHRRSDGTELPVEVTPVRIEIDGTALRVCFVDLLRERNELRLATLSAADLERHRLGQEIRDGLGPILARLSARLDEMVVAVTCNEPLDLGLLLAAETDATAATTKCRQLNRGASPIHFAAGDLLEAFQRMPEVLASDGGPQLSIAVWAHAPVELSLERSEHLYRIAHDAVRAALLRPGVRRIQVSVEVSAAQLSVTVDDDGVVPSARARRERAEFWPLDVRAAAARAELEVSARDGGGNRVRIDCRQSPEHVLAPAAASAPAQSPTAAMPATAAGAPGRATAAHWPWLGGLALFVACFATGAIGLQFLKDIDPRHVALLPAAAIPWLASGVAVAGVFLGGPRLAPAVFLATLAVWRGLNHDSWITVLADAVGETLAALLAARLLTRFGFRRSFDRFRDLAVLAGVAAVTRLVPALADAIGLHLAAAVAPSTLTPELLEGVSGAGPRLAGLTPLELAGYARWWINGVAGVVLVVPAVLPLTVALRARLAERWLEWLAFAVALGGAVLAIAGGPPANWRLSLLGLSVVLVAWAAVRFGVAIASIAALLVSLGAAFGHGFGLGPMAATGSAEGTEVLWGFVGLLGATGLFLTTVVAEHDSTMSGLAALRARFEALFEAIPRPLFAYGAPAGRITIVNAEAIRRYGYTREEFLALTPAMLAAEHPRGSPATTTGAERSLPSRLHRTRSGDTFEVELSVTDVDVGAETENLCFAIDVTERNELRRRVLEASDLERRRLAQELHDGLGQSLTGLHLGIVSVRRTLERDGTARRDAVLFMAGAAKDSIAICRQIVQGLSPLHATDGDLVAALRRLPLQLPPGDRERLAVEVRVAAAIGMPLPMREHLYQIAREAVNNAVKYADATRIVLSLEVEPESITLAVEDDGKGFDPAARRPSGLGLRSMSLRASALRGRLAIERRPGRGIAIVCRCPQAAV